MIKQTKIKKTICPLDCPDTCGMNAVVEKNKIIRLDGDQNHPFTQGFLCKKMRSYHQRVHSKNRILYPQLRKGKKGEGKFKRIDWEDVWDILIPRLKELKQKYGGEALLPYFYAGNMGLISRNAGAAFFNTFGSSQLLTTICSTAAAAGWSAHCPGTPGTPPEQALDSELIIAWGINIKVTNIHFWPFINKARKRGAKLIVIDPYKNITAQAADEYISVKPAGDTALAYGILKTLLCLDSVDKQFIQIQTTGFPKLAAYIKDLNWHEIVQKSGVSKHTIEKLAQQLKDHPKTFIRIGNGISRNTTGATSIRAIVCLAGAMGLFDQKKGRGILLSSDGFSKNSAKIEFQDLRRSDTRQINMVQLGNALTRLKPEIKMIMVYNCNPVSVAPDSNQVKKGFEREDLFTVVHEQFMTPTAKYADLLLPATTSLENHDIYTSYGHFELGVTEPVISPLGETKSNFDFFQELAEQMGYTGYPFNQNVHERIQTYLSNIKGFSDSIDVPSIQPGEYISSRFAKTSQIRGNSDHKKLKFVDSSQIESETLARLKPALEFENSSLMVAYPFRLITPPTVELLNSTFGERYPDTQPEVLIHPDDAESAGVKTGDLVILENQRGKISRIAKVTDLTPAGLLVAEGIYWETEAFGGINTLTSQQTTDLGGGSTFHESRIKLSLA